MSMHNALGPARPRSSMRKQDRGANRTDREANRKMQLSFVEYMEMNEGNVIASTIEALAAC
jgi:hypothetical protein